MDHLLAIIIRSVTAVNFVGSEIYGCVCTIVRRINLSIGVSEARLVTTINFRAIITIAMFFFSVTFNIDTIFLSVMVSQRAAWWISFL